MVEGAFIFVVAVSRVGEKQFDGDDAEVVEKGWNSSMDCEEGAVGKGQHY